ncbi:hypothetical protein ACQP1G_27125 [Nocardia sp. CA-107356]|uniref:hypothetical protein n=1 Tax=Nocardia sp. CA-107356 TaxID=3239972 RepID=UPI003D906AA7
MSTPFRTPRGATITGGSGVDTLRQGSATDYAPLDCAVEPRGLTYRQAREILHLHEVHGPQCRQWLAAAAYLSAGLDDE